MTWQAIGMCADMSHRQAPATYPHVHDLLDLVRVEQGPYALLLGDSVYFIHQPLHVDAGCCCLEQDLDPVVRVRLAQGRRSHILAILLQL